MITMLRAAKAHRLLAKFPLINPEQGQGESDKELYYFRMRKK